MTTEHEGIMRKLLECGYQAYLIGGACRDRHMGCEPHDFDLFTDASGEQILNIFPEGKVIGGEERQEKILTVIVNGVEVSQFRKDGKRLEVGHSLETHQRTCDITINSIAQDIQGRVYDPHGGIADLRRGIIRCVGSAKERNDEDPLRPIREIRFAGKYGFTIDPELDADLRTRKLKDVPMERFKEEFLKMLPYQRCMALLDEYGFLTEVIPEFKLLKLLNGGKYHNEDVMTHSFDALSVSATLTDNPILMFSAFMHDIGKAYAQNFDDMGGIHFNGHDTMGSQIIGGIMIHLKFSTDEIAYVRAIIKHHDIAYQESVSKRGYVRVFSELEKAGVPIEDFMVILYADSQGNKKHKRIKFVDFLKNHHVFKAYNEIKRENVPFGISDLAIKGDDLILMGIPEGKQMGVILRDVYERVASGEMKNLKPEEKHYVREKYLGDKL